MHHDPLHNESVDLPESFYSWSQDLARELAAKEGIELTDAHWSVLYYLRDHCLAHGANCRARKVLSNMTKRYKSQGGKKYLYKLFPRGAVVQACRIAGVPLPANAVDLSFGSVH